MLSPEGPALPRARLATPKLVAVGVAPVLAAYVLLLRVQRPFVYVLRKFLTVSQRRRLDFRCAVRRCASTARRRSAARSWGALDPPSSPTSSVATTLVGPNETSSHRAKLASTSRKAVGSKGGTALGSSSPASRGARSTKAADRVRSSTGRASSRAARVAGITHPYNPGSRRASATASTSPCAGCRPNRDARRAPSISTKGLASRSGTLNRVAAAQPASGDRRQPVTSSASSSCKVASRGGIGDRFS